MPYTPLAPEKLQVLAAVFFAAVLSVMLDVVLGACRRARWT